MLPTSICPLLLDKRCGEKTWGEGLGGFNRWAGAPAEGPLPGREAEPHMCRPGERDPFSQPPRQRCHWWFGMWSKHQRKALCPGSPQSSHPCNCRELGTSWACHLGIQGALSPWGTGCPAEKSPSATSPSCSSHWHSEPWPFPARLQRAAPGCGLACYHSLHPEAAGVPSAFLWAAAAARGRLDAVLIQLPTQNLPRAATPPSRCPFGVRLRGPGGKGHARCHSSKHPAPPPMAAEVFRLWDEYFITLGRGKRLN